MHEPAVAGFVTLYCVAALLSLTPSAKRTLYESPLPISNRAQAPLPAFGGTTETAPCLASTTIFIVNVLFGDLLIWKTLTGPFSPFESLYLKPLLASPLQNGLPVVGLTAAGSVNVWLLEVPP